MIIKGPDENESKIATLEGLRGRRDASAGVRKRIDQELRNIRAGIKGEEESAYEIDFHFGASKNYVVIHDLRIECEGRVAQIDHLVINRFLEVWVCESKHFSEGIAINEQGECSAFFKNKPYGVASPFEQNKKHIMVLGSLFKTGMVQLPKRLGFAHQTEHDQRGAGLQEGTHQPSQSEGRGCGEYHQKRSIQVVDRPCDRRGQ